MRTLYISPGKYEAIVEFWQTFKLRPNWPKEPTFSCNWHRKKWSTRLRGYILSQNENIYHRGNFHA